MVLPLPVSELELTGFPCSFPLLGVTPKPTADSGVGPESPETSRNNGVPTENAASLAADAPPLPPTAASPDQKENDNVLFSAVSGLNAQLTKLHAALPQRTAFLLFSGHSDPRGMSVLAARRAQYQASQNRNQNQNQNQHREPASGAGAGAGAAGTEDSAPVRWSTADERALEEAVARARMGLLFVGVKS